MFCATCRSWTRNTRNGNKKYGVCKNKKFAYGKSNDADSKEFVEKNQDGLLYLDYEQYSASFETGENFGCIHYKQLNSAIVGVMKAVDSDRLNCGKCDHPLSTHFFRDGLLICSSCESNLGNKLCRNW